jgi:uncharacterized protein with von Willebrand factor type A (vWA) domain
MTPDLPSPTGKSHAIVHDTWDKTDLKRALKEVRELFRARRKLTDQHPSGFEAIGDAFYVLHKADPHLVERSQMRASHAVNHHVIHELLATPAVRRLREYTVGDLMAAAAATIEIVKHLEAIFDRLTLAQETADKLQTILDTLAKATSVETDDPNTLNLIELLEGAAEDQDASLKALLAEADGDTAEGLSAAVGGAFEGAAKLGQVCRAWGVGAGELARLPADERLRLARALNTPRMVSIADLFGRISNLALSTTAEDVEDLHDDVVDLEAGSDLSRVLASEFLELAHPLTEPGFLARWASDELLQVTVRGSDEVGRGAIIMCIDGSGSMGFGERDLWAKATMLVLLHQARAQGRQMHVISFGYRQLVHRSFTRPSDFTAERIIEAAEMFWASGTDFEVPMHKAVEVLRTEFTETGKTRADVVFATDDECSVRPSVMADYLSDMHEMRARTWGLMVGDDPSPAGALWQMSEGRVLTVRDLTSGRDLRSMLGGIR